MKIGIIKLGATGDVVRTISILPALKEKFPDSEITWITKEYSSKLLESNSKINRVLTIPLETNEKFDILYNFDIDEEAVKLANTIQSEKKYGFYSDNGFPMAFNPASEYYLDTLFDDDLKKSNEKTYQQMMFDTAELEYKKHHEPIIPNETEKNYAQDFVKQNNINVKKFIGIHMGAGQRWPSKKWHSQELKKFINILSENGYEAILFGGPGEKEEHGTLFSHLNKENKKIKLHKNDPNNTILQFASLVNLCKIMVCSDSLALHISLALKRPTIGLFFVTSPNEVEDYGLLKKIISPMWDEFFPEKSDQYSEELTKSIKAEEVFQVLKEIENENK